MDIDGMLRDVHSEVEIDYSESNAPDASVYHGHAACRSFVQSRYEDFEERSFDAVELIDAPPNAVVAVGRMRGRGRGRRAPVRPCGVRPRGQGARVRAARGPRVSPAASQQKRPVGSSSRVQMRFASVGVLADGAVVRQTLYTDIDEARAAAQRLAEERE